MWLVAGALGIAITADVFAVLAVAARLMPAGPGRELAGFIPNCVVLLRRLRADRRLPRRARLALGAAVVYLISPVQLIPNFIPVIGQADDLVGRPPRPAPRLPPAPTRRGPCRLARRPRPPRLLTRPSGADSA